LNYANAVQIVNADVSCISQAANIFAQGENLKRNSIDLLLFSNFSRVLYHLKPISQHI